MEVLLTHCAALDVHKASVSACRIAPDSIGKPQQSERKFATFTADLLRLRDWLQEAGVTHVALESTGSYWRPIYNVLEGHFQLLLVNPHHIKNVPGRKTDIKDAQWICQLVEHGLVRPSFVPPKGIRELRNLTRYRKRQIEERAEEVQRLEKVLQEANGSGSTTQEYTSTEEEYGELLSAYGNGQTSYYECDGLGSTDALVSDAQVATDRYSYRAFGLATHTQGSSANAFHSAKNS